MSKGFVLHAGTGLELPGAGGSVLAGAAQTDGAFSLLLSHAPAGDGGPLHVHDKESESCSLEVSGLRAARPTRRRCVQGLRGR